MTRPRNHRSATGQDPTSPMEAGWFVATPHKLSRLISDQWSPDEYVESLSTDEQYARVMRGEALIQTEAYRDGLKYGRRGWAMLYLHETFPFTEPWRRGYREGAAQRARETGFPVVPVNPSAELPATIARSR